MTRKLFILFFFLLLHSYTVLGQDSKPSLTTAMEQFQAGNLRNAINIWIELSMISDQTVSDSTRMVSLMKLTQSYLLDYNDMDTTKMYLDRLYIHCSETNSNRCYVFHSSLESLFYQFKDDIVSAIQSGQRGINYMKRGGCDDLWFTTYTNYGYNFYQIGEIEKAREQYKLAAQANTIEDYDKLEYAINMSSTFENEPDSILFYSKEGLALCDTLQDIWLCPYIINNVAFSQASLGNFTEAEKILDQEFVKQKFLDNAETPIRARLNHTIGFVKSNLNKLGIAEHYLLKSLVLAKEIGSNKTIRSNLQDLSQLYEKKNNLTKSLQYLKEEALISESIHNEDIQKELANYENAKVLKDKENQIFNLEEENESISGTLQNMIKVALSLFLAMFLIGIISMYRAQQNKIKFHSLNNEISLAKLQSLQVSMNPHFLFNTFATLQLFILENKSTKALEYLGSLSNLLRRILYNSKDVVISVNEEIDMLESYFYLEAERFDNDITLNVKAEEKLLEYNPLIPAMILQPHLENAIHHGVSNLKQKGIIDLEFSKKNNSLLCMITDNGIGRDASATKKGDREHLSTATKNTSSRIEILKKLGHNNTSLDVIDLKDQNGIALGTRVEIELPFIEQI